jgi:hypothetical protein
MTIDPKFDAMLDGLREPAIWLRRTDGPARGSKLGGLPGLPRGVAWPRHGRNGLPLHFLAQIDLTKLPPTPLAGGPAGHRLPVKGALFFFADIEEEMLWDYEERSTELEATRVVFSPEIGAPVGAPADLPEINHPYGKDGGSYSAGIRVYPEAALDAFVIDTYAGAEAYFQGDASRQADLRTLRSIERATGGPVPVYSGVDQHMAFVSAPAAVRETKRTDGSTGREVRFKRHQMLGAATNVQGSANAARGSGLVPLLQLDSDWGVHKSFMFCDMGMAQFWIKPEDLRERRFERAWASTEGG